MVEICHSKNVKCKSPNNLYFTTIHVFKVMQINGPNISSSVGAARKVSLNWSQKTMTCHSSNCFSNPPNQ